MSVRSKVTYTLVGWADEGEMNMIDQVLLRETKNWGFVIVGGGGGGSTDSVRKDGVTVDGYVHHPAVHAVTDLREGPSSRCERRKGLSPKGRE